MCLVGAPSSSYLAHKVFMSFRDESSELYIPACAKLMKENSNGNGANSGVIGGDGGAGAGGGPAPKAKAGASRGPKRSGGGRGGGGAQPASAASNSDGKAGGEPGRAELLRHLAGLEGEGSDDGEQPGAGAEAAADAGAAA